MLSDLALENLALFDRAALELGHGLHAITGETGAGKSLIVGALELLLGERPRTGIVRTGAEEARVEGRFLLPPRQASGRELVDTLRDVAPAVLEDWDSLGKADERELVLARAVGASGRTRAWINHRPATLAALKRVAGHLVEIHGQNDHQRLFEPAEQTRVLDEFGGLGPLADRWRAAKSAYEAARAELEGFDARARERAERLDLLRFQAGELEAARITPEQHADLLAERDRLRWADDLSRDLGALARGLGGEDGGALDELRRARRVLESWTGRVAELSDIHADAESALVSAQEASAKLERFLAGLEADPARLESIEERLYKLETLSKKHRTDVAGLVARASAVRAELAELEARDESADVLAARVDAARRAAAAVAKDLTKKRATAAAKLVVAVHGSLVELGLAQADFRHAPCEATKPAPDAVDPPASEFFLAANPGEPARPLRHVASGGEAARILLAVRVALALEAAIPTLVFDEVDAGVGGRLGPQVGAHLAKLAKGHQVLCVTHLPAIAALADRHYRVSKAVKKGRTTTEVALLAPDARVDEVADMIAGGAAHATARAEARRLLGV
ncbi:MAG: DNA repair protein RecN [Planctomycetes bacterium]|nr:DNA repair protein RecN [Planctomycetota bacterium]